MTGPDPYHFLCRLDDIEDGGSDGFSLEARGRRWGVIAVRQGGEVFTYVNACPHIGAPLDFQPGQFLDADREHILCTTHGALFRIHDGYCISGPCSGDHLTPVQAETRNGDSMEIWVIPPAPEPGTP